MTDILFLIKPINHFSYFLYHDTMLYMLQSAFGDFDFQIFIPLKIIGHSVHKVQVNYLGISNQHPKQFEPDLLRT